MKPGTKLDQGKPKAARFLLSFAKALIEVVKANDIGADTYSPEGWKQVPEGKQRYTDALVRHLLLESEEDYDPETGMLHATAVAWNALARLWFIVQEPKEKPERKEVTGASL